MRGREEDLLNLCTDKIRKKTISRTKKPTGNLFTLDTFTGASEFLHDDARIACGRGSSGRAMIEVRATNTRNFKAGNNNMFIYILKHLKEIYKRR